MGCVKDYSIYFRVVNKYELYFDILRIFFWGGGRIMGMLNVHKM